MTQTQQLPNAEDILEDALNFGLKYSSKKHNVNTDEIYKIVKAFKVDIEDLCSCDKARLSGMFSMCFFCDGHAKRIKL